jgi:hypothetical protein
MIMSCAFHMVILFSQSTWEDDCACDSAFKVFSVGIRDGGLRSFLADDD